MPHVTVLFDPKLFPQEQVDRLKPLLPTMVAKALSSKSTLPSRYQRVDIETKPGEIFVGQYPAHPTDVNAAPFEIYIQAGRPKRRSGDKIVALLALAISEECWWIPEEYLGDGKSCIFVVFHEHNGFGFIPKKD